VVALSELELFRIIVEAGSLAAAAKVLKSSPPAVSRKLAALEVSLGVRLADRNARRFRLTSEGHMLFERSRDILDRLHNLESEIAAHGKLERGLLRVTAPSEFGRRHVARLIGDFTQRHPGLRAHLDVSDAGLEVIEEESDVVLRIGRPANHTAIAKRIASSRCVVCASPDYIRRKGKPEVPADIAAFDCLVLARRSGLEDLWRFERPEGGTDEVQVRPSLTSSSGDVLHSWVLDGRGISYEAGWDVGDDLSAGRLVNVLPTARPRVVELYATFAPGRPLLPRIRLFVDFLAHQFAGRGGGILD
jgi:DNA-binding transcriptional LysR family regulator